MDTVEYRVLRCGRTVPASLYKSMRQRVLRRARQLVICTPYTAKMICGSDYWYGLGGYKTHAGLVMADLVDQELVPFAFASERDAKPLWYRLVP